MAFSLILSFLLFSCGINYSGPFAEKVPFLERGPLIDLYGINVHFIHDALVVRSDDHHVHLQLLCIDAGSDSLVVKLNSDFSGVKTDPKYVNHIANDVGGFICNAKKRIGLSRVMTDLESDSSLVFVFGEKDRLQVFLGKRPNVFRYDRGAQKRFRINSRWDYLRLE